MRKNTLFKRAFRLYNSFNPRYFPTKFFQILFENLSPYFTLWMSAEIVTALYQGQTGKRLYLLIAVTLLGNLAIRVLGAALKRSAETQLKLLENNEAAAFNAKTLSLDYDKLENPDVRQHRRRILENSFINFYGVGHLRMSIENLLTNLVNLCFSLILFGEMAVLLAAAGLNWTGALLFAALIAAVALNCWAGQVKNKKLAEENGRVCSYMLEENRYGRGYSTDAMDNRIYKQQILCDQLNQKQIATHRKLFGGLFMMDFRGSVPVILTQRASELCSYLIVCLYCALGAFPVGSVIKYVGYLGRMSQNIGSLLLNFNYFKVNEPYLQVYLDYFDIPNEMYQGSLSVEKRSDKKFDVEFRDVSFRYPGSEEFALKHISLNLKVGERLAVVGMNGSGKTTFIKLLCRLYDPTEGEIFMNDFNIRKYDYRQYLDLFSVVFQDYQLLSLSLGCNIASSDHWDAPKAERLLEEVGLGERYAQMPEKLETVLYKDFDENGVNVSGGEAQKIALARALYKDAPFIILDEPTAALDPVAEAEIYAKFDQIVGDKTAIYISHRLSSCRFCDKIVVFDQGEIIQIGTHEELLADQRGKYYELWNAQAQYYVEKTV